MPVLAAAPDRSNYFPGCPVTLPAFLCDLQYLNTFFSILTNLPTYLLPYVGIYLFNYIRCSSLILYRTYMHYLIIFTHRYDHLKNVFCSSSIPLFIIALYLLLFITTCPRCSSRHPCKILRSFLFRLLSIYHKSGVYYFSYYLYTRIWCFSLTSLDFALFFFYNSNIHFTRISFSYYLLNYPVLAAAPDIPSIFLGCWLYIVKLLAFNITLKTLMFTICMTPISLNSMYIYIYLCYVHRIPCVCMFLTYLSFTCL